MRAPDHRPTDVAAPRHPSRRALLGAAGAAGAALWVAPAVLPLDVAFAQSSVTAPVFVPGSAATAFSGPSFSDKSISLTSGSLANPLLPGDLWVAYLSYDAAAP